MNFEMSQTVVHELGWTLVHFVWEGLAIAALLAASLRIFQRSPAQYKYLAACAALALMAIAPPVTLFVIARLDKPLPAISLPTTQTWTETTSHAATTLPPLVVTATPDVPVVSFSRELEMLFPWLVLGWVVGVCALSCRLFAGWLQVRRMHRTAADPLPWTESLVSLAQRIGVSRPVRLLQSALVEVPTVIGWLRPVILLPASCVTGLTPGQLESIIAHELAHIRRHDYLVNLLQSAVETLLFYHPAVWWVSRRIREERELCCDDLAVAVCGDRIGYARALATLEELRPASAQLALAAGGAPLLQRIRRLAGQPERSAGRGSWPVAGIALLLVLGILAAGMREHRAMAATPLSAGAGTAGAQEPGARTNSLEHIDAAYTGKGRQAILSRLARIRIGNVNYANLPLQVALGDLAKTALANDPERKGVNFYVEQQVPVSLVTNADASAPPIGGQPDVSQVSVHLALQDATLADVLDGIIRTANHPIKYAVLDYAVVFSVKDTNEPPPLEIRTFHVDPAVFIQRIESADESAGGSDFIQRLDSGGEIPAGTAGSDVESSGNSQVVVAKAVRKFLAAQGVDLSTNLGHVVIFNNRKGTLTVRATAPELDMIESAIVNMHAAAQPVSAAASQGTQNRPKVLTLAQASETPEAVPPAPVSTDSTSDTNMPAPATNFPPEVNIKAKFVEINYSPGGFGISLGSSSSPMSDATNGVTGVLSEPQFKAAINALEQRRDADILSSPEVTTESGRQAQMQIGNMQSIVITPGKGTNANNVTNIFFGYTLDALATVSSDKKSIQMKLVPSTKEFLGYDYVDTNVTAEDYDTTNGRVSKMIPSSPGSRVPMPLFRLRQTTANVTTLDGQTVVIGGFMTDATNTVVDSVPVLGELPLVGGLFRSKSSQPVKRELLIFVTATMINPNGTRYHTEEEENALPAVPAPAQVSTNR